MTRLGRLQTVLKTEGITQKVQLLAVSFDGAFDLPFRMEAFAQRRGFVLHEQAKCLRVVSGMSHLLGCLQPGVNFNNGLVNQHTVNFFMFDKFGVIKQQISSLEWEAKQVSKSFKKILNQKETPYTKLRHKWSTGVSIGYAILIAFFPKCPLCVAAYLSALGISSTSVLQYHRILLPVLILLLSWHLHAVFRRAKQRRWYLPLVCSLLGGCIVIWTVFKVSANWLSICGILLITIGAVLNSWDVIPSRFYTLARGMAYPRWTSSLSLKRKL
jgi:protein SCO1/2